MSNNFNYIKQLTRYKENSPTETLKCNLCSNDCYIRCNVGDGYDFCCQKCDNFVCTQCKTKKYYITSWHPKELKHKTLFICGKCTGTYRLLKIIY